jgi:hypothetical protein
MPRAVDDGIGTSFASLVVLARSIAVQAFLELLGTRRFKFVATGFAEIMKDVD